MRGLQYKMRAMVSIQYLTTGQQVLQIKRKRVTIHDTHAASQPFATNEQQQGPDFQKILSQTYDTILVKITLRHS